MTLPPKTKVPLRLPITTYTTPSCRESNICLTVVQPPTTCATALLPQSWQNLNQIMWFHIQTSQPSPSTSRLASAHSSLQQQRNSLEFFAKAMPQGLYLHRTSGN